MRSLYIAIMLIMFGILSVSFVVFRSLSSRTEKAYFDPVFDKVDQLEIESARAALEQGGPNALSAYMQKLDRLFGGSHYLLDRHGRDIISGSNRATLVPQFPATRSREQRQDHILITQQSADGDLWFVAVAPIETSRPWIFFPYYLLIASVITLLCWLAAVGLISPIRRVSKAAVSFGRGDLAARLPSRRQDEIGQLEQSFNQMADRLETLITSERRLLEDISHELRTPLSRLKLATKLARTSSDQQSALDRIERDVDRMASLVGDLIEITRMEGDPCSRNMTSMNLKSLVEAVVDDCRIEAETRGCSLVFATHASLEIVGNRELLRRALENVVRNAIRYSPNDSIVDITLTDEPRTAIIEVRDRGPGVPEESLEKIFEPFFRVEAARDKTRGGCGLGLSIAGRALELHDGQIGAANASPGLMVKMAIPRRNHKRKSRV